MWAVSLDDQLVLKCVQTKHTSVMGGWHSTFKHSPVTVVCYGDGFVPTGPTFINLSKEPFQLR